MADRKTGPTNFKCDVCQTTHSNQFEYNNHVMGGKHKRKVAIKKADLQNNVKKQLYETKGVFIGNLPPNTMPDDILAYVASYGNIESSIFGTRFVKILFSDERDSTNFKKRKHVFRNHTLRVNTWKFVVPAFQAAKPEDKSRLVHDAVANALKENMDIASETAALCRVLLPPDQTVACNRLCVDLTNALRPIYPKFSVHPFGSVVTGLAFRGSDLDVVVDTTFTLLEYQTEERVSRQSYRIEKKELKTVSKALGRYFYQIIPIIGAKIPIITCMHRSTKLSCDISFTNITAVQNSNLIGWYLSSDDRVKPLMVILKFWGKLFDLTKNYFTNYALVMMGLFYLMQLDDPILPPVIHLQTNYSKRLFVDGWNCSFNPNHHFEKSKNTSSVLDLLKGFFEFYAHFDYGMKVVCPLIGKALPKMFFQNVEHIPPELTSYQLNPQEAKKQLASLKIGSFICVQDPFLLDCNITRSIPQAGYQRIQAMCLSSAFVLGEERKDATTGVLKHLLMKRTAELTLVPSLWNKSLRQNIEIKVIVGSYLPIVGSEATLSDAQNAWHSEVFTVITNIFKNIFKFEIEIENITTDAIDCRTIICKSKGPDLRTNRKQVGKELVNSATDSTISFLEMQERITRHMLAIEAPVETAKFKCCFRMMKDPTHIILELSDVASSIHVFKSWAKYLVAHLTDWVTTIMDVGKSSSGKSERTTNT